MARSHIKSNCVKKEIFRQKIISTAVRDYRFRGYKPAPFKLYTVLARSGAMQSRILTAVPVRSDFFAYIGLAIIDLLKYHFKVIDFLFNPGSIAVIGASQDPQKVGYAVL